MVFIIYIYYYEYYKYIVIIDFFSTLLYFTFYYTKKPLINMGKLSDMLAKGTQEHSLRSMQTELK